MSNKMSVSSDEEQFEDAVETCKNNEAVNEIINNHFGKLSVDDTTKKGSEINENESNRTRNEDDEDEKYIDCNEDDFIDDEQQKEMEKSLTEEEKYTNKEKADEIKNQGNNYFKAEEYQKSIETYTTALRLCPVEFANDRAILYGNRAAAKIKLDAKNPAIEDCTKSLEFNPKYTKVLLRRARLYETTEKLDESLADYKQIVEIDPDNTEARCALVRLPPIINERNEKMKTEMIGKLKDLGNIILKPFGLSTNNFQMQQDPSTGGYSINFNQNPN